MKLRFQIIEEFSERRCYMAFKKNRVIDLDEGIMTVIFFVVVIFSLFFAISLFL